VGLDVLVAAPDLRTLRAWVERGGSLVVEAHRLTGTHGSLASPGSPDPPDRALGCPDRSLATPVHGFGDLTGVVPGPGHPVAEWFVTVADPGHPVVRRSEGEFAWRGSWTELLPGPGARPLLTVSTGYRPACVLAERRLGAGRVVTVGFERPGAGGAELDRILARARRRPSAERTEEQPIGVGIVGYGPLGGMGHTHGLAVQETAGLELVAVCDPVAERRKEAEGRFPDVRAYPDLDDLLADPDVAVAVVATPPATHHDMGLSLLRAGRHVVMEKPLCFTVAEVDELVRAASQGGVSLTVHQNRRWDADFLAVRRAVEAGELGEVFNVETFVGGFDHPCRAWHSEVTVSGGAAYDWGSHHLDWILVLLGGAPARVSSTGHKRVWHDVTNLDQERIHLWWDDGREAEFLHSDVAAVRRPKFWIQGTAGTLVGTYRPVTLERIEPGVGLVTEHAHHAESPAELRLVAYAGPGSLRDTAIPLQAPGQLAFHRNLADHLLDGDPLAVTVTAVRPVVATLQAAARSSAGGGRIVALDDLESADDVDAAGPGPAGG